MKEEFIAGGAGKLFVRTWDPTGPAHAIVAIVPGFNSHGGYYLWAGPELAKAGFAVSTVDLRGRGKSDGERYYINSFGEYLDDIHRLIALATSRNPGLPVFLIGHSAGGVASCGYVLEHQADLAGFVCESFAFQVPAPDVALAILKGLGKIAPHGHVLRLKIDDFSRDPAVLAAMHSDPDVKDEVQPNQTVAEMVRADERLERDFGKVTLPLLIIHGTEDKVTRPEGSQLFFDRAGSKDKTLKLYEGYAHDPLNDIGKERVMADLIDWIGARIR